MKLNELEIEESVYYSFEKAEGLIKFHNIAMDENDTKTWVKIKLAQTLQKGETYFLKIGTFNQPTNQPTILTAVSDIQNNNIRKFFPREVSYGNDKATYSIESEIDYQYLHFYFEEWLAINLFSLRNVNAKIRNNHIYLVKDGKKQEIVEYPGVNVNFTGEGSEVMVHEGAIFKKCSIFIHDFSKVEIEATNPFGIRETLIDFGSVSAYNTLVIKRGCSIGQGTISIGNEHYLSVVVGEDNMWSTGVTLRASDGHIILDKKNGRLINRAKPLIIGKHVWIGAGATILKGSIISDNSIIGSKAVVTKKFVEENVAIAGNPAKIVRSDVEWQRDLLLDG